MNIRELLKVLFRVKNKTLPAVVDGGGSIEHVTEYKNGVVLSTVEQKPVKYVILDEISLEILTGDNGSKIIFDTEQEAINYTNDIWLDAWQVIEIAWHTET